MNMYGVGLISKVFAKLPHELTIDVVSIIFGKLHRDLEVLRESSCGIASAYIGGIRGGP